ncbi:hypothetical protein C8E02_1838 [Vogesella indigofera]|uniref:HTH cro/C1-type domain-containing protein n=3 Tax=Chromobacteriaceae TaxID=1499392 RepID=A0A495BD32_VOGIN|nr:hypothetical protein C8E02_1838 [Vogesella indigofera]GGX82935.1 hypothetical protein GCM10011290_08110 [Vogesella alkaliphila]
MSEQTVADGRVMLDPAKLKKLRRDKCFSQDDLAEHARINRCPVSTASIKRAELGTPVRYRTAKNLAQALGVEVNLLFSE